MEENTKEPTALTTEQAEEKIQWRIKDFKERLDEMGLLELVSFEQQTANKNRYNLTVERPKTIPYGLACSAVMGLIAHFQNRKWIKDWSYVYIMKSSHSVTFSADSD